MKNLYFVLGLGIFIFAITSCERYEEFEMNEMTVDGSDNIDLKAATVGYDSFYDSLNWSFTNFPTIPIKAAAWTLCGYSPNNRWGRLSWNWSACPLYPDLASTSNGYLQLTVPGNSQKKGAQIETIRDDYWYGSYARIKAGAHSGNHSGKKIEGSCNSFFFYNSATQQEIDIEILTNEHQSRKVHFVTHPGNFHYIYTLPSDPTASYIEYGYDWYVNKIVFFVNGIKVPITGFPVVPTTKGKIILNHWTGNSWSGTPPPSASNMSVDYVRHVPFLLVTFPDSPGITWAKGNSKTITWDKYGDVSSYSVNIELWKNGSLYQTIKNGAPNSGTFKWTIPASIPTAENYQIKVISKLNSNYFDISNNGFTIQ